MCLRPAGVRWPLPDFLPAPVRPPLLAWVALAAAALLCALAADEALERAVAHEDLLRQIERAEAARPRARPAPVVAAARPEAARAAQQLARRLDHPWQQLFEAAEGGAAAQVRWLRLEHDAERGELRLAANAPNRDAVLATLDRLAATPRSSEVMLLRVEDDPRGAGLRFELRARYAAPADTAPGDAR